MKTFLRKYVVNIVMIVFAYLEDVVIYNAT